MNHNLDGNKHGGEWVLLVPPKLTKSSFHLLTTTITINCVMARPWHLDGRHGSRTHVFSSNDERRRMAIPITSRDALISASQEYEELQALLEMDSVEIVWAKERHVSSRHYKKHQPSLDATIHAERRQMPPNYKIPTQREASYSSNSLLLTNSRDHATFTFAELFAGIGGFGVALEALGGKCVFCSEIDASCRQVYQANLNNIIHPKDLYGDIYTVQDSQFPRNVDLLVAGFPCQPFSTLGQQPGFECEKGNLFLEIVRFLQVSQPRAFLLENVPGLVKMKDTFHVILKALEECGYKTFHEVLDARGVTATTRKRLYIVGLPRDIATSSLFEFPFIPDLRLRARNVIDYNNENDFLRISDEQLQRLIDSKYWKPAHLAWPDTTIKTLVSHYGNSIARGDSQLIPTKDKNPRRFSARECASLMGFPRSYQLPTKQHQYQGDMAFLKQQYRMFGNAVCPPMIAVLAGAVLDKIDTGGGTGTDGIINWIEIGRETAVRLAYEATLPEN